MTSQTERRLLAQLLLERSPHRTTLSTSRRRLKARCWQGKSQVRCSAGTATRLCRRVWLDVGADAASRARPCAASTDPASAPGLAPRRGKRPTMIEVICNDRLGKKVRVKCKYVREAHGGLRRNASGTLTRNQADPVLLAPVAQPGRHHRRLQEAGGCPDRHGPGKDCPQEMVRAATRRWRSRARLRG